jgi:hypothetical protein
MQEGMGGWVVCRHEGQCLQNTTCDRWFNQANGGCLRRFLYLFLYPLPSSSVGGTLLHSRVMQGTWPPWGTTAALAPLGVPCPAVAAS